MKAYTCLISFRVLRVSGSYICGLRQGCTNPNYSGGDLLATCEKFDRLGIWTHHSSRSRRRHLCYLVGRNRILSVSILCALFSSRYKLCKQL